MALSEVGGVVTEDYHITLEVKRTSDGTFIRAHIDGVEAQDEETTRALIRKVMPRLFGFAARPDKDGRVEG